jgi:hypothetical protein
LTLDSCGEARAIAITPDSKIASVTLWGELGTAEPIAPATNTPGSPIPVGDGPYAIAVTQGSSKAQQPGRLTFDLQQTELTF